MSGCSRWLWECNYCSHHNLGTVADCACGNGGRPSVLGDISKRAKGLTTSDIPAIAEAVARRLKPENSPEEIWRRQAIGLASDLEFVLICRQQAEERLELELKRSDTARTLQMLANIGTAIVFAKLAGLAMSAIDDVDPNLPYTREEYRESLERLAGVR